MAGFGPALRVCWLLSVRPGLGDARGLGEEYQAQLRWFYLLLPGDSLIRQFPFGKLLQRVHVTVGRHHYVREGLRVLTCQG